MSIKKLTTNPSSLHALREEIRQARSDKAKPALTITVEDAIFTRLVAADELLTVASGLFDELAAEPDNWLFKHAIEINNARSALNEVLSDRP